MSNRHLSRTLALQTLFEWDFNQGKTPWADAITHARGSFAPDFDDQGFTEGLVKGVVDKQEELNGYIVKYAPAWPLDKITVVDRNVLRLGIYELKYSILPPKVSINEAIELAKAYGGPSSGKFINGVLGSVFKELEAEGVFTGRERMINSIPVSQTSAGGVVFRIDGNKAFVALIQDGIKRWTFPKGHVEDGENLEVAAKREIEEELGLKDLKIIDQVGDIILTVNEPGKDPARKRVYYFAMTTEDKGLEVNLVPGVSGGQWYDITEAEDILGYDKAKEIFKAGVSKLKEKGLLQ
ncbi:MAG: transcription antitermination factor NusB [bacterium]